MNRRYATWAGNPLGVAENIENCIKEVWAGMRAHQCTRKRGYGPNKLYCKQHGRIMETRNET